MKKLLFLFFLILSMGFTLGLNAEETTDDADTETDDGTEETTEDTTEETTEDTTDGEETDDGPIDENEEQDTTDDGTEETVDEEETTDDGAIDDGETTEDTEDEDTEDEEVEDEESWGAIIANIIANPTVFVSYLGGSTTVFIVVVKIVLSRSKKAEGTAQNVVRYGDTILALKDELDETYNMVKFIAGENKYLKDIVGKVEKSEEFLVSALKEFIKQTNIPVDGKIELAKMFDEFKRAVEEVSNEEDKDKVFKTTLDEFAEDIKAKAEEEGIEFDEWEATLKNMTNDDNTK